MDFGLKDKTVLVTGSSSGIGKATAIAFGAEGAQVAVTYHKNQQGAEATAQEVINAGGKAIVVHYDLADRDSIRSSIERIQKEWDTLHVLVNNAVQNEHLAPSRKNFEDEPIELWESMLRSSLEGFAYTLQCALPLMRKSGWGRIISVSSDAVDGWPGLGAYATAKSGLEGLTRTLKVELGPANILSNVVMPGFVLTEGNQQRVPTQYQDQIREHTPTRQLVTPQDLANTIVFLGSQANRQITGEVIRVTGGR
ncbi:MAG: SDR family oxidoreductase [Anaerolineae bacterium]|nr:SDR family oxidoreductase [Anaerolineae bacterium]